MMLRFSKVWLVLLGMGLFFLAGAGCVMAGAAPASIPDEIPVNVIDDKPVLVPDEIVVKFKEGVEETTKTTIIKTFGLKKLRESRKPGKFTVFRHANPKAVLAKLRKKGAVEFAEQNAYAYAFGVPNDTYYKYQWHMKRIGMEDAWDLSTGEGAIVAVVDTGVRQNLTDLDQTKFTAGYDFVNNDTDPTDDNGHGSHVTGTIAQSTNNTKGVCGIAYNATIMPVKVLNAYGSGTYTQIVDGINWAVEHGANIINLSLGGSSPSTLLEQAINNAWQKGVLVVCAAGNSSTSAPSYPAAYENAVSVVATAGNDTLASYSNYGSTVDIAAPGGDYGDYNGDGYSDRILQNTFSGTSTGYYFYSGTSMASPHVAGVAALIKAKKPSLTNAEIRDILYNTADDLGSSGKDTTFGYGMVNALAALRYVETLEPDSQSPKADFSYELKTYPNVAFTDKSTGSVTSWSWEFGDGETSIEQSPEHTYAASGKYNVTLTVTDDSSGLQNAVTKEVTVTQNPTADFTFTATDLTVTFTDGSSDSDGSIASRSWNFGDGASSTAQNP
ncbi:MAG: S8 family serine peptidase, partial [Deltaproteobacteria bacterium]|nr:S8 family serine peptidase [Deltaproteobacteria bacterium]